MGLGSQNVLDQHANKHVLKGPVQWRTPIGPQIFIRDLGTRARCMVHMHDFRRSRGSVPRIRETGSLGSRTW